MSVKLHCKKGDKACRKVDSRASNVNGKDNQLEPHSVKLYYQTPELPRCQAYYCRQMRTKALCNYSASPVGDGSILRELSTGFRVALTTHQPGRSNTCCSELSSSSPSSLFLSAPGLFSLFFPLFSLPHSPLVILITSMPITQK